MKIQTLFLSIVALVLISFSAFHIHNHSIQEEKKYLHFFVLSQNDDFFQLKVDSTSFTSYQADDGDMGQFSYVGKVLKNTKPMKISFKAGSIDTTFDFKVRTQDSLFIGLQNDGQLLMTAR